MKRNLCCPCPGLYYQTSQWLLNSQEAQKSIALLAHLVCDMYIFLFSVRMLCSSSVGPRIAYKMSAPMQSVSSPKRWVSSFAAHMGHGDSGAKRDPKGRAPFRRCNAKELRSYWEFLSITPFPKKQRIWWREPNSCKRGAEGTFPLARSEKLNPNLFVPF